MIVERLNISLIIKTYWLIIQKVPTNFYKFSYEDFGKYEFHINDTKIKLKRVLYSPDVTINIISAIELAKIGIKTITEPLNKDSNIVKLM